MSRGRPTSRQKTVFNYFATKEDLFYDGMVAFEERLLDAIRDRAPGETVLGGFRAFVLAPEGVFAMKGPGTWDEADRAPADDHAGHHREPGAARP